MPVNIRSIAEAITIRARASRDSPALIGPQGEQVSFGQLLACINSFATLLSNAGLSRDDHVGLVVPVGLQGAQLVVALACNVALVPMNPALTPQEMVEMSRVSGLRAVVIPAGLASPSTLALLDEGLPALEAVRDRDGALSLRLLTRASDNPAAPREPRDTDVALVLRSSGTTGAPKLIPVTHRNLLAMAEKLGSQYWFDLSASDRAACLLPLYYAAGLKTSLFVPLILGASVAFPPPGLTLDLGKWLKSLRPTYLSVAPGLLNGIVDRERAASRAIDADSLRFVMCAAAYLPSTRDRMIALCHGGFHDQSII